ncbi:MAG: hypothetical protein HeimC2_42540 [Candidatus Heimdallarchaeota archaeon LC_2]|nr:MAG: hypothetical protein HeimC2_42540 [Candidatus Heimdallarchaeota archaeon LC_2]
MINDKILCPYCEKWFAYRKIRIDRIGEGSIAPGVPAMEHIIYSCPECNRFLNSAFVKTT